MVIRCAYCGKEIRHPVPFAGLKNFRAGFCDEVCLKYWIDRANRGVIII